MTSAKLTVFTVSGIIAILGVWGLKLFDNDITMREYPIVGHRYYKVSITYEYRRVLYTSHWVNDCILYDANRIENSSQNLAESKWLGFGKKLSDGSGAFFQMRRDMCRRGETDRLLINPSVYDAYQGPSGLGHELSANSTASELHSHETVREYADRHSAEYIFPAVYWLNDAYKPTFGEFCGFIECVTAPNARLRVIQITAERTNEARSSDPSTEVPALGSYLSGSRRFVGYACWRIPLAQLGSFTSANIDYLDILRRPSAWTRFAGTQMNLPLMNAWTFPGYDTSLIQPLGDVGLTDTSPQSKNRAVLLDEVRCSWSDKSVNFENAREELDKPIALHAKDWHDPLPKQILLSNGEVLSAGQQTSMFEGTSDVDPVRASASALGSDHLAYIAEAIVLRTHPYSR